MLWIAYIESREIGDVDAPDKERALARARARWGQQVRVISRVEAGIQKEEREALARDAKRWQTEQD